MSLKPLPVGLDDFAKVIRGDYYYVDKTLFIKELLDKKGEVNLFTRPRRFGKTLNMSMLHYFFEDPGNAEEREERRSLFDGLKILEAGAKYTNQMGKYPVIALSLKSAKQMDYEQAIYALKENLSGEYKRHAPLLQKMRLNSGDEHRYQRMIQMQASREECNSALYFLSYCLYQAYGQKAVILIDEYDVPLENAYFYGFYDQMVDFIRSLFESALKSNSYLEFGVITGCLRITKESIFTGLNNMKMISILSDMYDEYFGFTQAEVDQMLAEYGRLDKRELVKEWYNGYRFGMAEVYNPWSVINYTDSVRENANALPVPYWANTSSNDIVRSLIERADMTARQEMEELMSWGIIEKPVHEEITYDSIYDSKDYLWNFLFFTGYLRQVSLRLEERNRYITMSIPNEEVAWIYENTITRWFQEQIKRKDLNSLYKAMLNGDCHQFQKQLSDLLLQTISYMDSKENFYHGFLLGILGNLEDYSVTSNRESGNGRYDIMIKSPDIARIPVIMELKVADSFKGMADVSDMALKQIIEKKYGSTLSSEGYSGVICYGIAFFRKQCHISASTVEFEDC